MATKKTKKKTTKKSSTRKKNTKAQQSISTEIYIWITFAISIFLMISNFGMAGFIGAYISSHLFAFMGWVTYLFPILLFGTVTFTLSNLGNRIAYIKTICVWIFTYLLCIAIEVFWKQGGVLGERTYAVLKPAIGMQGTILLIFVGMVICIVLITEKSILGGMRRRKDQVLKKAHNDMAKRRESQSDKREQSREESRRAERKMNGISFNTTIKLKKDPEPEAEAVSSEPKGKKVTKRTKKSVEHVFDEANKAAAQHIFEQTGQLPIEDITEYEAMPISAVELKPEEEAPKVLDVTEKLPAFLKDAMVEAGVPEEKVNLKKETDSVEKAIAEDKGKYHNYKKPPLKLLASGAKANGEAKATIRETALKLQKTLQTFGVNVTITNISCGSRVTRYELQPEMGVKVSKIVGLADDIKLNLAAEDIRIEAPIPGKAAVGIEVPNKVHTTVMLRDLLESSEFKNCKSNVAFATGMDITGQVVVSDIAKMPHLLVAGATGSGKSVCINTLIMSILYKASPEDVKLIMVDPKVVELSIYNGIPHLMIPVVTDPKKAAGALNWAVAEMEKRFQLFAEYNVRDMDGYNRKVDAIKEIDDPDKPKKMSQIVIIVDELADLMMVAANDVEESICRLAQKARAAGMHLVLATQRPSVDVITGLIKANMPSRIAFSVSSGVDSRTIIDMNGAEKLLGNGDMLFYPAGYVKPVRVQGAFVSDKEVQDVVEYLKNHHGESKYDDEIQKQVNSGIGLKNLSGSGGELDAYFVEAGRFVIEKDRASSTMLQRVFKIGFNRAARIMDQLYEAGVIGEEEGTKPRKVMMSMEQFEQYIEENV